MDVTENTPPTDDFGADDIEIDLGLPEVGTEDDIELNLDFGGPSDTDTDTDDMLRNLGEVEPEDSTVPAVLDTD